MADVKISQLPAATTPLDGTELTPIVQSGTTKRVSVANLTVGRALTASSLTLSTPLSAANGGTGLTSLGTGIATFLETPTSANLAAAVTDETGTGALVFGTSPTFTTSALFPAGTVSAPGISVSGDTDTGIYFPAADTIGFVEGGVESMRLDASGNLGLGVTPSAWGSSYRAFQGYSNTVFSGEYVNISSGAYNDNTNWKYISAAKASRIDLNYQGGGGVTFFTSSASGTAGNDITFIQAMTLDASGRLGVGTTSPVSQLHVNGGDGNQIRYQGASNTYAFGVTGAGDGFIGSISNTHFVFFTDTTERMRLDNSGNIICGTAALATNATNGFLYIPTCAGTPTGTPTAYTGRSPIVVDTTNNKLYFYSGGTWRDAGP